MMVVLMMLRQPSAKTPNAGGFNTNLRHLLAVLHYYAAGRDLPPSIHAA